MAPLQALRDTFAPCPTVPIPIPKPKAKMSDAGHEAALAMEMPEHLATLVAKA